MVRRGIEPGTPSNGTFPGSAAKRLNEEAPAHGQGFEWGQNAALAIVAMGGFDPFPITVSSPSPLGGYQAAYTVFSGPYKVLVGLTPQWGKVGAPE